MNTLAVKDQSGRRLTLLALLVLLFSQSITQDVFALNQEVTAAELKTSMKKLLAHHKEAIQLLDQTLQKLRKEQDAYYQSQVEDSRSKLVADLQAALDQAAREGELYRAVAIRDEIRRLEALPTTVPDTLKKVDLIELPDPNLFAAMKEDLRIYQASQRQILSRPPRGTVLFNGHRYLLSREKSSYYQAYLKCKQMGGHLVRIESQEEYEFVKGLLAKLPPQSTCIVDGSDILQEGDWRFGNGQPMWTKWKPGNPLPQTEQQKSGEHLKSCFVFMMQNADWCYINSMGGTGYWICEWDDDEGVPPGRSSREAGLDRKLKGLVASHDSEVEAEAKRYQQTTQELANNRRQEARTLNEQLLVDLRTLQEEATRRGELDVALSIRDEVRQRELLLKEEATSSATLKLKSEYLTLRQGLNQYQADQRQAAESFFRTHPKIHGTFRGHRYKVFPERLDHLAAMVKCERLGGHLVRIESRDEYDFIVGKLRRLSTEEFPRPFFWVDGFETAGKGDWRFSNHLSILPFWSPGYPKNFLIYRQDGVEHRIPSTSIAFWEKDGVWAYFETLRTMPRYYICEWDF